MEIDAFVALFSQYLIVVLIYVIDYHCTFYTEIRSLVTSQNNSKSCLIMQWGQQGHGTRQLPSRFENVRLTLIL